MTKPSFKIFQQDEMSASDFRAEEEHVTAHDLLRILQECPAKWKFEAKGFDKTKKNQVFGATARTMMTSSERFYGRYERLPLQSDFADQQLITSVSGLQGWLKERGLPGRSGTDPFALIELVRNAVMTANDGGTDVERMPVFWHEVLRDAEYAAAQDNKEAISGDIFDSVVRMRNVILAEPRYAKVLEGGGTSDLSVFGTVKGVKVKVRFNRITEDMEIWDYRTTRSANPANFCRNAYTDYGYAMKMALEYHVFRGAYDKNPNGVYILAQEKEEPFIPLDFRMSRKTLLIGQHMLTQALALYAAARDANVWPSFNGGDSVDLDPPEWMEKREFAHLFEEEKVKQ